MSLLLLAAVAALALPVPSAVSPADPITDVERRFEAMRVAVAKDFPQRAQPATCARMLHLMVDVDQAARTLPEPTDPRAGELLNRVDAHNRGVVKALLAEIHWFTISTHGTQADQDGWLLVQHADADVALQREVLHRLVPLSERGEASRSRTAYLWDRVAVNETRKQRYGTQGRCMGKGRWEPQPIEDPAHVDERRAQAEIVPVKLADYVARMHNFCH